MTKKQHLKVLFMLTVILCLSVSSLGQDKGRTSVNRIINKADQLLEAGSEVCIKRGKQICEDLLKDEKVKPGSMEEGYLYERIAFADDKIGRGLNWDYYNKAVSIYEQYGTDTSKLRRAMIFCELAAIYNDPFRTEKERQKGVNYLLKALKAIENSKWKETKADIFSRLAEQYFYMGQERLDLEGDPEHLILFTEEEENVAKQVSENKTVALNYLKTALEYDTKALDLYVETKNISEQSKTLCSIGMDYFKINNNKDVCLDYFEKALKLSRKSSNSAGEIIALISFGEFYSSDVEKAENYYNKALKISKQVKDRYLEKQIYLKFIFMYKYRDEKKAAIYDDLYEKLRAELKTQGSDCITLKTIK